MKAAFKCENVLEETLLIRKSKSYCVLSRGTLEAGGDLQRVVFLEGSQLTDKEGSLLS